MLKTEGNNDSRLSISVVSHGQGELVRLLLQDLQQYCREQDEVIVTLNIEEPLSLEDLSFHCPVTVIRNKTPLGFGANHNQAFSVSRGRYFCVINPDIRLPHDPFPGLLGHVNPKTGVAAPGVVNSSGRAERSARSFPTPLSILKKAVLKEHYHGSDDSGEPDWVAGMFMIFPAHVFQELHGFDERYFLYYEDVDICARLRLEGYEVALRRDVTVQHDGQWKSHSDPVYRRHHLKSMARYFLSAPFLRLQARGMVTKLK